MKTRPVPKLLAAALMILTFTQLLGQAAPGGTAAESIDQAKPAAKAQEKPMPAVFEFGGGSLNSFVAEVKQQLDIDLWQQATVPEEMHRVMVPKMRVGPGSLDAVLNTYNAIAAEGDRRLGHWIHKYTVPGQALPGVIILVSPRETAGQAERKLSVRAFFLRIGAQDREKLMRLIDEETNRLQLEARNGGYLGTGAEDIVGRVRYHEDSDILVATGTDSFISLTQSLVEAFRDRAGRVELKRTDEMRLGNSIL